MDFKLITLPTFGILESKLDQKQIDLLKSYIRESAPDGYTFDENSDPITHSSDNQWSLLDVDGQFQKEVLIPLVSEYVNAWGHPYNKKTSLTHDYVMNRFWVRITTPDQYQSLHDHQGVFSFIIWINIPTDWRDERAAGEFSHPEASDFQIAYTDTIGRVQKKNYLLDKSMEGTIIIFPSDFNHCVYPSFTSDKLRISVAGDIAIDSLRPLND